AEAAIAAVLGGAAVGTVAALGEVAGEGAVRHRGLAATSIRDGPGEGPAAVAGAGIDTAGLVSRKRAVRDGQGRAGVVGDAAARRPARADGLVPGERAVRDLQSAAGDVGDGAARGDAQGGVDGAEEAIGLVIEPRGEVEGVGVASVAADAEG